MRAAAVFTAALALVPTAFAVDQSKSAIIWFEDDSTPDWIVNEAKDNIIKAGGKITHTYTIIKFVSRCHSKINIIDFPAGVSRSWHPERLSRLFRPGA